MGLGDSLLGGIDTLTGGALDPFYESDAEENARNARNRGQRDLEGSTRDITGRLSGAWDTGRQYYNPALHEAERLSSLGPTASEQVAPLAGAELSVPGTQEQYFDWAMPGIAAGPQNTYNYAASMYGGYQDELQGPSYSEQLYGADPGLGAYYDRANEVGQRQLDDAMAAMGLHGSAAQIDQSSEMTADLMADMAYRNADYQLRSAGQADNSMFQRVGEGRNWAGEMYDEGRGVDELALDYLRTGGDLAGGADAGRSQRLNDLRSFATDATSAERNRHLDAFDATDRAGGRLMDSYTEWQMKQALLERGFTEDQVNAIMAAANAGEQQEEDEQDDSRKTASTIVEGYKAATGKKT